MLGVTTGSLINGGMRWPCACRARDCSTGPNRPLNNVPAHGLWGGQCSNVPNRAHPGPRNLSADPMISSLYIQNISGGDGGCGAASVVEMDLDMVSPSAHMSIKLKSRHDESLLCFTETRDSWTDFGNSERDAVGTNCNSEWFDEAGAEHDPGRRATLDLTPPTSTTAST